MKKLSLTITLLICALIQINGQYSTLNAHSHNDYVNEIPFWLAYNNHFGSIEADIWEVSGNLLVAHSRSEIKPDRTIDSLYINPIVRMVRQNGGRPWSDNSSSFQLLIDIKTNTEPALSILTEKLKSYPDVFDVSSNKNAVRIVITGNRPEPSGFSKYPAFILFDGLLGTDYNPIELRRIALYSENLKKFTQWNGEGNINEKDKIRLQTVIDSVHGINKKIRFWNAPDDINAWNTFMKMGIDYLNTDHIVKLSEYLNKQ